jgi:hypothetical protein
VFLEVYPTRNKVLRTCSMDFFIGVALTYMWKVYTEERHATKIIGYHFLSNNTQQQQRSLRPITRTVPKVRGGRKNYCKTETVLNTAHDFKFIMALTKWHGPTWYKGQRRWYLSFINISQLKMAVFWVVARHSLIDIYWSFRGTCSLHL